MNKNTKMPRKLRKILVEKKRRERIDGCLKQIKELLFQGTEFQSDYMRMEKADILENVVKFIKCQNLQERTDRASSEYRLGYIHCMREVTQVMEQICGKSTTPMLSLQHYFDNKLNNLAFSDTKVCLKEDSVTHGGVMLPTFTTAHMSAFSPAFTSTPNQLKSFAFTHGQISPFYSPNDSYHHKNPHRFQNNRHVIKIEPQSDNGASFSMEKSSQNDSGFESGQIHPDSTSVHEEENKQLPESINNNNNNEEIHHNNENVDRDEQSDDMWRPW